MKKYIYGKNRNEMGAEKKTRKGPDEVHSIFTGLRSELSKNK